MGLQNLAPEDCYNPSPMETGLRNRVAIVAASSQGIGRATAEAFAAEGCRVAMCSRNAAALEAAATAIRQQYNVEVLSEPLDVTNAEAVRTPRSAHLLMRIELSRHQNDGPAHETHQ